MKVNISGKGLIPVLKRLAPVRGADLSEKDIRNLITYRYFKLYVASSGIQITSSNIDELFKPVVKKPTVVEEVKKVEAYEEPKVEIIPEPIVEEKVVLVEEPIEIDEHVQIAETPSFLTVNEITSVVEETPAEVLNDEEAAFDEVEKELEFEEKPEEVEEKPRYYGKKKRKH